MNLHRWVAAAALGLLLPACQSAAPKPGADTTATWPDLQTGMASASGAVYSIDPAASDARIYVFRDGAAARLGHNHVLRVTRFEGYVNLPSDDPRQARFDLRVPLDQLTMDEPALRRETGGGFAGERSAADIEGTRRNMLGAQVLDAAQFPQMRLRSLRVEGDWPVLAAEVEITLHGVTQKQTLMLHVERSDALIKASGQFALRQSDYGIKPFSALGGIMKVADAVAVSFEITAKNLQL